MKNYGLATVSDFLGDNIVYRNLQPMDPRLPRFAEMSASLGMTTSTTPRKSEPDYARVMAHLLQRAAALDGSGAGIRHLVYVGDTRLNDGTAFANLCEAGGWLGIAFIGSERVEDPVEREIVQKRSQTLYLANRWSLLDDFHAVCGRRGVSFGSDTAVILDLDKTTLGARGRNDHVINAARLEAVRQTVQTLLGSAFDAGEFETSYNMLNQTEFHPFTTDNQDYLAYLCLILGSDLYERQGLVTDIRMGTLARFTDFLDAVEARAVELPEGLGRLHDDIYKRVKAGDATPFKAFRFNEFLTTVGRMGTPRDGADLATRLAEEILLTQEAREAALAWRETGALLFGLSDKPDEASVPSAAQAAQGYAPIHRTPTHAVGAGPAGA